MSRLFFSLSWPVAAVLVAFTLQATTAAQTPQPVRTVPFVDLDRYVGEWFEVARFPNRFQRQCIGDVRASYARRPDGQRSRPHRRAAAPLWRTGRRATVGGL